MLVLTRTVNTFIVIDTGNEIIEVTVLGINGPQVKVGIDAPKHVAVHRNEIHKKIQEQRK